MSLFKETDFSICEAPSLPEDKEYHVFFSYEHANHDRNWVKAVVRELENKGFKCCVYEKDRNQSKSFSTNIQYFIGKSMRIVLVLSSAYIKGDWEKMEMEITSRGTVCLLVHVQKKHGISFWEEAMDMHHVSTLKTAPTICPVCK
jgi:hypothetical protein